MKKQQKRTESGLIKALTQACELSKSDVPGFEWLTHSVDYKLFPNSLQITCVFDTQEQLLKAKKNAHTDLLQARIERQLSDIGISLKKPDHHIHFDCEEACAAEHAGDWQRRMQLH